MPPKAPAPASRSSLRRAVADSIRTADAAPAASSPAGPPAKRTRLARSKKAAAASSSTSAPAVPADPEPEPEEPEPEHEAPARELRAATVSKRFASPPPASSPVPSTASDERVCAICRGKCPVCKNICSVCDSQNLSEIKYQNLRKKYDALLETKDIRRYQKLLLRNTELRAEILVLKTRAAIGERAAKKLAKQRKYNILLKKQNRALRGLPPNDESDEEVFDDEVDEDGDIELGAVMRGFKNTRKAPLFKRAMVV